MDEHQQTLDTLRDIRSMMDRSSRLISLSGLSGVSAGMCALVGAWVAAGAIEGGLPNSGGVSTGYDGQGNEAGIAAWQSLGSQLIWIAAITFASAVLCAFLFTWLRSRKTGVGLFGPVTFRLVMAVGVPIFIGYLFSIKLMQAEVFGLIAPACLLFYGLGLVNASRYTTNEIRYLGYSILTVAILNLFFMGYGLYFWAFGFGILHIAYGIFMWNKYERENPK